MRERNSNEHDERRLAEEREAEKNIKIASQNITSTKARVINEHIDQMLKLGKEAKKAKEKIQRKVIEIKEKEEKKMKR